MAVIAIIVALLAYLLGYFAGKSVAEDLNRGKLRRLGDEIEDLKAANEDLLESSALSLDTAIALGKVLDDERELRKLRDRIREVDLVEEAANKDNAQKEGEQSPLDEPDVGR